MKLIHIAVALAFVVASAESATLPGFRIQRIGPVEGFPTSLAIDSKGTIYYTTTAGAMFRFSRFGSEHLTDIPTHGKGNSGLLGMALLDDETAVVHYTTPMQTHDVISIVDLRARTEEILHSFPADIEMPGRESPSEHHGGNPMVAPDGSIFVGIGDYSWNYTASDPRWNGGKIFRLTRAGEVTQFARGLRNPFDMLWDEASGRLIVADNGPVGGDEIHIIEEGAYLGWPHTYGTLPPVEDAVVPDYVFPMTTAPTGMVLLNDKQPYLRRGFLVGAFVTRAIYYFAEYDSTPLADPFTLIEDETAAVIDLAQAADGTIYFVTGGFMAGGSALYRLLPPKRGDCNGDGLVNVSDRDALEAELREGTLQRTVEVHGGEQPSSWGCDADQDGFVTAADIVELNRILSWRRRAAGK